MAFCLVKSVRVRPGSSDKVSYKRFKIVAASNVLAYSAGIPVVRTVGWFGGRR